MGNIKPNRILVTGAEGQLGHEFQFLSKSFEQDEWLFTDVGQLDITESEQVNDVFHSFNPTVCINCAAYTAVDQAESDPDKANRINVLGPTNLTKAARGLQARLIHFSSDYVYHNGLNRPLKETDPTDPKSVYANSKLEGDLVVLAYDKTIVIRSSWIYSPFGHNFVKTMKRLGAERDELSVVYDQIGTPTYAFDIAQASMQVIQHPDLPFGLFNFSNGGVCSWYDFALAIMEEEGLPCQVRPILSKDYPTDAERPPFSVMDTSRWKAVFQGPIPHWRQSLRHCLDRLA